VDFDERLIETNKKLKAADTRVAIARKGSRLWLRATLPPKPHIDKNKPYHCAIAIQLTLFAISLIKFRKFPSFHTYTAKTWGLTLLAATIGLFGFGYANTLWLAIVLCWLNSLEEIIMTLVLSTWQCDILSIFHVVELRKTLMHSSTSQDGV
jgi:hypothetical protein